MQVTEIKLQQTEYIDTKQEKRMTVDITQEEMNILNLNGISADEVRDDIQYMRSTGLDDVSIRNQYSNTINELKPITKISPNDTANIKSWQEKGAIAPYEYAQRKAVEFNGTYDNIDNNANLNLTPEQKKKREERDAEYQKNYQDYLKREQDKKDETARIRAERKAKNAERDKRVNEGTASFLDRVGSYLDRQAEISARINENNPVQDPVLMMSGVNNGRNVDKSQKINFTESLGNSFASLEWIPFIGGFIGKADDKKQREIQQHILKGEPIRQDELNFLNHRLENQKEEAVRGYTLGGNIAHDFMPSLVRFGGEIAAGGWVLKSLGITAEAAEGANILQKAGTGIKNMTAAGVANTLLPTSYNDTFANYQERRLNQEMEMTDKGSYIFRESDEKPAISFLKSLGQTFVMFASEHSGELLGLPIQGATGVASKYVGTPISKYLFNNPKLVKFVDNTIPALSKVYEKLNNLPIKGKNIDWLKNAVKYDGFLEEMGEEVVEDVLNLTLGTGDDKRTLENYAKAIFKSPDEWAVIAGAIALQGGTLSVASHVLGGYMERNGASDDEIIETLNNLSEAEKESKIQELISENLINIQGYTNEESQKKNALKDAYFNQIKQTGMEDDEALTNATLMSEAFAALAKNTGTNLDDVTNEANIVIQNLSDEQAQQQYEADNSAALSGGIVYNDSQLIDEELEQLYNDYDALPEDYSDEEDLNNRVAVMQLLQDIKDGNITEENEQSVQSLISQYEQINPQLANVLKSISENKTDGIDEVEFQKIDRNNIENTFGSSVEDIQEMVKGDVMNILEENDIDPSEFNFEDIRIYGSYSTGKNKQGSDLDLLVQYSGDMSEDVAFNMLNESGLTLTDKNGQEVKIDINPINVNESGSIDDHLEYLDKLEPKYQKVDTAGAENNQTALAQQEWKKKGTESKYFKKWFGDSKVVDRNGQPEVVYHGTENNFKIFKNLGQSRQIGANIGFFFTDSKKMAKQYANDVRVLPTYLSLQNPLIVEPNSVIEIFDEQIEITDTFDFLTQLDSRVSEQELKNELEYQGYDGIILRNTNVDTPFMQDMHDVYIAFNPEQIKSVNNKGTFNPENPNIYFQESEDKNLLMTHSAKLNMIDNIIMSGSLVAPSMAITKKGENEALKNFGDVLFVRNPKKIDFQNDNIFDRDIYSPRMPAPSYELENGRIVDSYEYDSLQRMPEERFEKSFGTTKEKYFSGAKKVLNLGYTPSGNLKIKAYNANTLLEYMQKEKLLGGENFDYGLSSLLAKLSKQQTSKEQLKETAIKNLQLSSEELRKQYEEIREKYNHFDEKLEKYYIGNGFVFSDQHDIFYAVAKNNKRKLSQYLDLEKMPKSLLKEMKDLINEALKLPRNYFESKPIRKVYLEEFSHALAKKGTLSDEQKRELSLYGIEVVEYENDNVNEVLQELDKKSPIYFQDSDNIENARGFTYERKNFDGTAKENLIVLLNKKADKSTLMHEFAHVYLITLNNLAQHNDRAKELLMNVNKWLHYDGVEYTEFQHERFANTFVAYVKSGKAPSYGLKRVFENFRRWLNDMYSNLQAADDVWIDPETEKVFEELLGNITINAQKEEAEQIINKARNNSLRRYTDDTEKLKRKFEKKQLTEYQKRYRDTALSIVYYALKHSSIPEASKYTNYNQLQMILLASSEYKKKSKGVAKQQEEIGNILAELDDAFSANDGFLPEWSEFFADTGVGYDTQDIGGDTELASQAFDVLVNGRFIDAVPETYEGEYKDLTEEEQARTDYELEFIIDEYKNADDKTIPLIAYNIWSGGVHPYIEEDIQKKWETATNEIDRYQSLNKFEQAKEDLKLYAATLKGYGDYSTQFAQYARAIVKRLDFMTESDKAKLFDKLKDFNSFSEIERNLDDVMDYAQTLADMSDRKYLGEQIDKEVRQTIHVWQNGIKKTKYTYPANKLFERLREINKMSSSTVQDMYDAIINEETESPDYADDSVHDKDYYSIIEQQFIKYKINGVWYNTTEFLQDLLERIQSAKYTAKLARDEMDFERRMQQINLVDECARAVNARKDEIDKNEFIKTAANFNAIGANLNNYLEMIFNENIKKQFSLDYLFSQRDAKTGAEKREFEDKAKKIFGFEGKFSNTQLYNKFIDMTIPAYKIMQRYSPDIEQGSFRVTQQMPDTGFNATQYTQQIRQDIDFAQEWNPEEIELSKMEILYYYIQAKNPTSYVILTDRDKGQFDKFDFDTMIDTLTPQEKLLGDLMQISAERYWNALNAYHIKKYQVELGKVKNYFPRYTDFTEEKPFQIFNDFAQSTSSGSMQKQRIAGAGSRIKPANALAVLYDHMETANTISIMGEHLDLMNRVLLNKDLLKKIDAVFGSTVELQYQSAVTSMLYKSQSCIKSLTEDFFSNAVNNSVKAAMFAKPTLAIKQVISFMNYGKGDEYVTAAEWTKEFTKQTLTPTKWKSNIDYMMNIPYLKDRYLSGGSMDALKRQLTSMLFPTITSTDKIPKVGKALKTLTTMGAKLNLLDEYFGKYIAMGDIGAIILGGKPYIEVLKNKGYTEEQAIKIFIETTVNDQQSSIPSTLSNAQRSAAKQPFAKMFFNFQNTPWQYYRHCTSAIMRVMQNPEKKNIVKAGKMLFCYGWLFPAAFSMVGTLSPLMAAGGDPDDLLKDINPIRTLSTLLTQHPLFGDMLQTILAGINGEQYNASNVISTHLNAYNKFLRHMVRQKLTPIDVWNAVAAFGEERTGIPLLTIGSRASGLYDMTQGEIPKGLLKYAGYTNYRAKKILGEE